MPYIHMYVWHIYIILWLEICVVRVCGKAVESLAICGDISKENSETTGIGPTAFTPYKHSALSQMGKHSEI